MLTVLATNVPALQVWLSCRRPIEVGMAAIHVDLEAPEIESVARACRVEYTQRLITRVRTIHRAWCAETDKKKPGAAGRRPAPRMPPKPKQPRK